MGGVPVLLPTLQVKAMILINSALSDDTRTVVDSVELELTDMDLKSISSRSLPDPHTLRKSSHLLGPKVLQVLTLRPGTRTDVRKKSYKTGVDAEEARRRREDNLVEIRKNKREDSLLKKRREGLSQSQQQLLDGSQSTVVLEKRRNCGKVKGSAELLSIVISMLLKNSTTSLESAE
ncbi:hypothetical protein ACFXTH_000860 [Malus domestica]